MLVSNYVVGLNNETALGDDVFNATVNCEELRFLATDRWVVRPASLTPDEDADVVLDLSGRWTMMRVGGALVSVDLRGTALAVRVAARTRECATRATAEMRRRFPEVEHRDRDCAQVTFWNWTDHGVRERPQTIDTPPWSAITTNYAASVVEELDALMARTSPPDGGRLILWHGAPGTGKTHLIRALLHAWRDWCTGDYIVDVDALLHGSSEYLTGLVLDGRESGDDDWRLVILEDAGEFLLPDAARTQGQGFSRLLNTLDGLLGQTARLMVLVTTNRPLAALDTAITRPGRCAMTLEIPPLSASEAAAWLARHDHTMPVGAEATLAQLYGILRGDEPPAPRRAVGFVA